MGLPAFVIWILIATVEVAHGILRARFLAPKVGDFRSRQIGVFTGSLLIYFITYISFDWLNPTNVTDAFSIGFFWFIAMLVFELTLGRFVFKFPWKWLLNDFNIFQVRLLGIGMILLMLAPFIMGKILNRF